MIAWPDYVRFRDKFEEAIDARFYPIDYLDHLVASGNGLFFCNAKSAIIVEIKTFPSGAMAVHGLVAAGKIRAIRDELIPQAEEFGRRLGCAFGIIESSPGWARVMKKSGYEVFQTAIVKEL